MICIVLLRRLAVFIGASICCWSYSSVRCFQYVSSLVHHSRYRRGLILGSTPSTPLQLQRNGLRRRLFARTPWGEEIVNDDTDGEEDLESMELFGDENSDAGVVDSIFEKIGSGSDRTSDDGRDTGRFILSPFAGVDLDSLDGQLLVSMAAKGDELFDAAKQEVLTREAVIRWDRLLDQLLTEISRIKSQEIILKLYGSVLRRVALMRLDPLQMTTFQLIAAGIADQLMEIYPKNTAVTDLVDEITDMHLEMAEVLSRSMNLNQRPKRQLQRQEDNDNDADFDSGSYSMTDEQEFLCYQYSGLVRFIYRSVSTGLGADFEQDDVVGQMRLQSWVDPIYARMQRRFVRFIADNVDDRLEQESANSFTTLMSRLQLELSPKYMLSGPLSSGTVHADGSVTPDPQSTADGLEYPPWALADFVVRVIRNAVLSTQLVGIEPRVNYMFRSGISRRMQALSAPMLALYKKSPTFLTTEQFQDVEDMLNIGHECVAAVLTMWQVRHNIVGVPVEDQSQQAGAGSSSKVVVQKDYLRPVVLHRGPAMLLESIPVHMRKWTENNVREDIPRLQPDEQLHTYALLATSVRKACEESFVGLSSFNLDSSEFPPDRDGIYMGALTAFLTELLVAPIFHPQWLYENLVAFAALEETIAVRSPRASCQESYQDALVLAVLRLLANKTAAPMDLQERVAAMERALGMLLRMEEADGQNSRIRAFKSCIQRVISSSDDRGDNGIRMVQEQYEWIASMLSIDAQQAQRYVEPLGFERFDQTVMQLFMNADVAVSMPEMGDMFIQQISDLAEALLISEEDARDRAIYVAGMIFIQYVQLATEQHRKQRFTAVDTALQRAFVMFQHPLLVRIAGLKVAAGDEEPRDIALQMACMDKDGAAVMDLVRVIDAAKKRAASNASGGATTSAGSNVPSNLGSWGGVSAPSTVAGLQSDAQSLQQFEDFLKWIQTYAMKQFTQASMKGSNSRR